MWTVGKKYCYSCSAYEEADVNILASRKQVAILDTVLWSSPHGKAIKWPLANRFSSPHLKRTEVLPTTMCLLSESSGGTSEQANTLTVVLMRDWSQAPS
jgi:hypothetical protein